MLITPFMSSRCALSVVLSLVLTAAALGQDGRHHDLRDSLPNASLILAKHKATVGDVRGHRAIRTIGTITGTGIPPGARFERYQDREGRYQHETRLGSTVVEAEWWNGRTAGHTLNGGSTPLSRGQIAAIREQGVAFGGLTTAAVPANAQVVEWSDFFGCRCVKLRVTDAPGDTRLELYDAHSGQLKGIVRNGKDLDGRQEDKLTVYIAYRDFEGMQIPVDIIERDGRVERRMRIEGLEWDPPTPSRVRGCRSSECLCGLKLVPLLGFAVAHCAER